MKSAPSSEKPVAWAGKLNMGLDEGRIRQTTDFGELVATLAQLSQPTLVAGLDTHQCRQTHADLHLLDVASTSHRLRAR